MAGELPLLQTGDLQKRFSQAAFLVSLGGVFSLLAGLAVQVTTAYLFGAGAAMDAFFTALTIPLYLNIVLLGGLPFVVIPAFVQAESQGQEQDAWALVGTFLRLTSLSLLGVAILGAGGAGFLIRLSAPGFGAEQSTLAAQMLTIMMFSLPFMGLASFTSGVENARGRFFWPATATAVGSLGNLLTLFFGYAEGGPLVLAWGNLISAILQALVTTLPVWQRSWQTTLKFNDPRVQELLRLIAPFIFFGLITSSKILLERFFASGLPTGQLSFLGYAGKISNIFVILFATSVAAVIFPTMARAFSHQGLAGLTEQTSLGLRLTLALAFPAVLLLSVVAIPLVQVFFERGSFVAATTLQVSFLIPIVMINDVLFRMISNVIARAFFVLKDTFTTNLISSLTIILYFLVAKELTARFGYYGLALAQPIQAGTAVGIMFFLLVRKIKKPFGREILKKTGQYLLLSLLAAGLTSGILAVTDHWVNFFQLGFSLGSGALFYLCFLWLVDREMALLILGMTGVRKIFSFLQTRNFSKKLDTVFSNSKII